MVLLIEVSVRPNIGLIQGQVFLLQDKPGGTKVCDSCNLFSQRVTPEPLRHEIHVQSKFHCAHVCCGDLQYVLWVSG